MTAFPNGCLAKPKIRRIWWIVNIITIVYCNFIAFVGYIVTTKSISTPDIMYVLSISSLVMYVQIFAPIVTRKYRTQMETVIRRIDEDFSCIQANEQQYSMNLEDRKKNSISMAVKWFLFLIIMFLLFLCSGCFQVFIFCNENCLSDPQSYLFVTPYLDRIHSYRIYALIQVLILPSSMIVFLGGCCLTLFYVVIGCEFHNAYLNLCARLHRLVDETDSVLRQTQENQLLRLLQYNVRRNQYTEEFLKSSLLLEFKQEFASIVRQHTTLTKYEISLSFKK